MVKEEFREEDGWETIPGMDEFWSPETIGDRVKGVYTNHESDIGINHSEVYTLNEYPVEDSAEPVEPIVHKIFGTTDLNNKFTNIEVPIKIGDEVGIIYEGTKPSKPPKKPFKMFTVKRRAVSTDSEDSTVMGDPIAVKCIDEITNILIDDGIQPTEMKIKQKAKEFHMAKEEGYKDPKILGKIEKQLNLKG